MTGRRAWRVASRAPADVNAKLSAYSPLAAQLLYNRGVTDLPSAKAFLSTDEKLLEDSLLLPDIQSAVSRINRALRDGETIGIFGDFDADGVTATALLEEGLARLGGRVIPYLPHRVKEGHGLNSQAVHALHEQGVTLLVTVDCGVTSVDEVSEAASLGMDTIITDHHTPLPRVPDACAIVNPKLDGSIYPFPHLAGVGLAFKLVTALYASMDRSWDETLLQLAALGTVTDVTPLVGENRYIVAAGLRSLNTNPRPGLKELLRLAGLEVGELDTETIAYTLGPRLNAPGRLEHASKGYDLLRAASAEEAAPLARDLERMNRERQGLTQKAQDAAKRLMGVESPTAPITVLWSEEFQPGIAGLLASRLVEERWRPAVVVALDEDLGRGSCRSIPEFDLASALTECGDLFDRFGGHPRAAGFVIPREKLPLLKERLEAIAVRELSGMDLQPAIDIDAYVRISSLMGDNFRFLQSLAPYGEANPKPVFLTKGVKVLDAQPVGAQGNHLRLKLHHEGSVWAGMAFGLGADWSGETEFLDIVYSLSVDTWGGSRTLKLIIQDFQASRSA